MDFDGDPSSLQKSYALMSLLDGTYFKVSIKSVFVPLQMPKKELRSLSNNI